MPRSCWSVILGSDASLFVLCGESVLRIICFVLSNLIPGFIPPT